MAEVGAATSEVRLFGRRLERALAQPRFRFVCILLLGSPFFLMYVQAAIVVPWTIDTQWDFRPAWVAAVTLAGGATPYPPLVLAGHWRDIVGVPYAYPPLEALLLRPLAFLSYDAAAKAWLVFNQGLMVLLLILAGRSLGLARAEHWLLLAIALFSSFLLQGEIQIGQLNLLITVLLACWLVMHQAGRAVGVIPIGVAAALKLYPSPQVLVLLLSRRWKAAAGMVTLAIALTLLTPQYSFQYFTQVFPHVSGVSELRENTALSATVVRLFNPPAAVVTAVWALVAGLALVLAVLAVRRLRDDPVGRAFAVLVVVGATPFLSPLMEYGHLVPMTLVAMVGAPLVWRHGSRRSAIVIAIGWVALSYHHLFYGTWGSWGWGLHAWESSGGIAATAMYAGLLAATPRFARA